MMLYVISFGGGGQYDGTWERQLFAVEDREDAKRAVSMLDARIGRYIDELDAAMRAIDLHPDDFGQLIYAPFPDDAAREKYIADSERMIENARPSPALERLVAGVRKQIELAATKPSQREIHDAVCITCGISPELFTPGRPDSDWYVEYGEVHFGLPAYLVGDK